MKKLLMAAALFMSTFAAKADDAITASLKVTSEKDAATVHVSLNNESATYVAFQFDITFPETMEFDNETTNVSTSRLQSNKTVDLTAVGGQQAESTNFIIATNWVEKNKLRVIGYNLGNEPITQKAGEILSITVKSKAPANNVADWSAKFETVDFVTESELNEAQLAIDNATDKTITGEADANYEKGDVNHSGKVDGIDLALIVNHVLGKSQTADIDLTLADMDDKNGVNGIDIALVINKILGK